MGENMEEKAYNIYIYIYFNVGHCKDDSTSHSNKEKALRHFGKLECMSPYLILGVFS